jgi:uncharacterized protein
MALKPTHGETILWRRLDCPGHDACKLESVAGGFRLAGATAFRREGLPALLSYELTCDAEWRTREGGASGWFGGQAVDWRVERTADGLWRLNGEAVTGLDDCADLDFGVTPATNFSQMRRIALGIGRAADVPVAWLDPFSGAFERLAQRYERRSEFSYWYEAPRFEYAELLEVRANGFIGSYPRLWLAED